MSELLSKLNYNLSFDLSMTTENTVDQCAGAVTWKSMYSMT